MKAIPENLLVIEGGAAEQAPLCVTIPEAAQRLRLSTTTIKKAITEGKLRSILIFGARRIPYSALVEFSERGT